MPKNIYLVKENYKKVEEIREIENEIPTYEEFLKNYNADEKVDDSYENELNSYSDIGVSKGFGPCYVCRKPTQWASLHISCPTISCSSNMENSYWYHSSGSYLSASDQSGCGRLEISNNGNIKCQRCGISGSIKDWKFSCSYHSCEYRSVSSISFVRVLSLGINNFISDEMFNDLNVYLRNH